MRGAPLRRFLAALARGLGVVLLVAVASLVLMHFAPGDPLGTTLEGANVPPDVIAAWRARMGADQPLPLQVGRWLGAAATGDLGYSVSMHMSVARAIRTALPYTALLGLVAIVLGFAGGIALAFAQARARGRALDRWLGGGALAVWAAPEFVVGLVLVELFAVRLGWFPSGGAMDVTLGGDAPAGVVFADRLRHLVLPAVTMALVIAAQVGRHQRVALVEAWREPFIRAARARGLRERALWVHHAWRAALGPTIALAGLSLPLLAGGAFVIERIFNWPGMGSLAFQALADRDPHLALGCVVAGATLVVLGGALADVAQAAFDPRRAT
ncbi:MAG: ABC transporter permease [Gemmatimonadetes bacterium]|nr:ABC transporter permease [Gemmatimonadota bacterium]